MKSTGTLLLKYRQFCKTNRTGITIILLFVLFTYGIRIAYYSVPPDTASMMQSYDGLLKHYITLGRYEVSLTKLLLNFNTLQPWALSFLSTMMIFLYSVTLAWIVYEFSYSRYEKKTALVNLSWVIPCLFITHPIMAEQYVFTLQALEVSLAILFSILALFFNSIGILEKKRKYLLPGLILLVWSFGAYQAMIIFYVIGVIITVMLLFENEDYKAQNMLIFSTAHVIICFVGFILYLFVRKLTLFYWGLSSNEYLVDSFFAWNIDSWQQLLSVCIEHVKSVILGNGVFYNLVYALSCLLLIVNAVKHINKRKKEKIFFCFATAGLVVSPFLLTFLLGRPEPVRAQFPLAFMVGGTSYLVLKDIKNKYMKIFLCVFFVYMSFVQANQTQSLFYTDYVRELQDQEMAFRIIHNIEVLSEGDDDIPVIFVGKHRAALNPSCIRGDIIGTSHFEYGKTEYLSTSCSNFIRVYLSTLGNYYSGGSEEQSLKAIELAADKPAWPSPESVFYEDGMIIVKLSNE